VSVEEEERKDKAGKEQNDFINQRLTWLGTFEGLLFVADHYGASAAFAAAYRGCSSGNFNLDWDIRGQPRARQIGKTSFPRFTSPEISEIHDAWDGNPRHIHSRVVGPFG